MTSVMPYRLAFIEFPPRGNLGSGSPASPSGRFVRFSLFGCIFATCSKPTSPGTGTRAYEAEQSTLQDALCESGTSAGSTCLRPSSTRRRRLAGFGRSARMQAAQVDCARWSGGFGRAR